MNRRAIGVFDSGLGGLTVLKEIIRHLPGENTIYLGDTARVPYGIRSPEVIVRYSFENTGFLMSREIKLLVIACNTASAISLEKIRESVDIDVIGVIGPGARAALRATKTGRVGVIGTETTIKSGAYARTMKSLDPGVEIFTQACPLFVPLVEEGWVDNQVALLTAEKYLHPLKKHDIDTLVLGCTHYPLLKKTISKVMGKKVILIDSGAETAREISGLLQEKGLLNPEGGSEREFYSTDAPQKFKFLGSRFLGPDALIQDVKLTEVWNEARWKKK